MLKSEYEKTLKSEYEKMLKSEYEKMLKSEYEKTINGIRFLGGSAPDFPRPTHPVPDQQKSRPPDCQLGDR